MIVKSKDIYDGAINLWMAAFCGWMSVSGSVALGKYYDHGTVPDASWAQLPEILLWGIVGIAAGTVIWYIIKRLRMYPRRSYNGPKYHNYR